MTTANLDLQRRCAELAGWTKVHWLNDVLVGWPPVGVDHMPVPDYPRDLNAVRELEALLSGLPKWRYIEKLRKLGTMSISDEGIYGPLWAAITATAEQRCRAFVEVMQCDSGERGCRGIGDA